MPEMPLSEKKPDEKPIKSKARTIFLWLFGYLFNIFATQTPESPYCGLAKPETVSLFQKKQRPLPMPEIKAGSLLISEPYLGDPNFERTVVLVCRHDAEGTF